MTSTAILLAASPVIIASVLQFVKEYLPLTQSGFYLLTTLIVTVGTLLLFWVIWSVSVWILLFDIAFAIISAIAYVRIKNDERRLIRLIDERSQNGIFSLESKDLESINYPWTSEAKKEIELLKNKGLISGKVSYYD